MSRGRYLLPTLRWCQRLAGDGVIDRIVGALTDPFDTVHMEITPENAATQWNLSAKEQGAFAVVPERAPRPSSGSRLLHHKKMFQD